MLLAGSALLGTFSVFLSSAATAIFLGAFGAGALPLLYVGSAILVASTGVVYARLESRISVRVLLPWTLIILLAAALAIRVALAFNERTWVPIALAGFGELAACFAPLTFWAMAGRMFDVRQAKRLFGPIGAGEVAATSIGGFTAPLVVGAVGTPNLLGICAVALLGLATLCHYVIRAYPAQFAAGDQTAEEKRFKVARSRPRLTHPYVALMLLFAVLATVTYYGVATAFLVQAQAEFPTQDALAGFLGVFTGVLALVGFAGRSLLAGRVMERFGIRASLLLSPLAVVLTAAAVVGTGVLPMVGIPVAAFALFVVNCVSRICMEATWDSIYKPAFLVLYQPLPARNRLWLQTTVEGVAAPIAQGLAGLGLLAYGIFRGYDPIGLSLVSLAVAASWVVVSGLVGRRYVIELLGAVARRTLGTLDVRGRLRQESASAAGLRVLEHGLNSDQPNEVLYTLAMLDESEYARIEPVLTTLITHAAPAVREAALRRIETRQLSGARAAIVEALGRETEPAVRAAALGALAMADPEGAFEPLKEAIDDAAPEVRLAGLVGLLRYCGAEGGRAARDRLSTLFMSQKVEDRVLAAQTIGKARVRDMHFAIGRLLRDGSLPVTRAALTAAGELDLPDLWTRVVQRLVIPSTARAAATALIVAGPTAMPFLEAAFALPETPRALRLTIVRLCGRIRDPDALELLLRTLAFPDAELRRQTLRALDACDYRASGSLEARIPELVAREVMAGAWISAAQRDLATLDLAPHVLNTFTTELEFARERALLLLSLVYNPGAITRCISLLAGADAGRRAYAIEILDNILPHSVKGTLFPLLDDLSPERRLAALGGPFRQERLSPAERMRALASRSLEWCHPWSLACWLHAAGVMRFPECRDALQKAAQHPVPLIAETGAWALAQVDAEQLVAPGGAV